MQDALVCDTHFLQSTYLVLTSGEPNSPGSDFVQQRIASEHKGSLTIRTLHVGLEDDRTRPGTIPVLGIRTLSVLYIGCNPAGCWLGLSPVRSIIIISRPKNQELTIHDIERKMADRGEQGKGRQVSPTIIIIRICMYQ